MLLQLPLKKQICSFVYPVNLSYKHIEKVKLNLNSNPNIFSEIIELEKIGGSGALLLGHWYEIMAPYYIKSILIEISASRQDRGVLQKNKIIRI